MAAPLPSEKEEVWRYSPIDRLDLDAYGPAPLPPAGEALPPGARDLVASLEQAVGDPAALVVVRNGSPVALHLDGLPPGLTVHGAADQPAGDGVLEDPDALTLLNGAFMPDVVTVEADPSTAVDRPVLVVHWVDGTEPEAGGPAAAAFPRTVVRAGRGSQVSVVEVFAGAPGARRALVAPVTQLSAEDGAHLDYVSLQVLGPVAWHIGRLAARAGRDATLRTFGVGLGADYDRTRTDAVADGPGAHSQLRSAYLGTGSQVHDVRTLQDHRAPHTTSDLLCKGAVTGASHSVYSGLIRVRRGAVRTSAMQTNQNLVLDETAHADSVPNLDIEENDVRCSHASTVGPVDEDQRYYLESRGIPPERARWLIVRGFFQDVVEQAPVPQVAGLLGREVATRLAGAVVGAAGPATGDGGAGA